MYLNDEVFDDVLRTVITEDRKVQLPCMANVNSKERLVLCACDEYSIFIMDCTRRKVIR